MEKLQGNRGEGGSREAMFPACTFRRHSSPRSTQWVLSLAWHTVFKTVGWNTKDRNKAASEILKCRKYFQTWYCQRVKYSFIMDDCTPKWNCVISDGLEKGHVSNLEIRPYAGIGIRKEHSTTNRAAYRLFKSSSCSFSDAGHPSSHFSAENNPHVHYEFRKGASTPLATFTETCRCLAMLKMQKERRYLGSED